MARRFERAGRAVGTGLDRAVRLLEKEAAVAARTGKKMQRAARKRSVRVLRRASEILSQVAARLEETQKRSGSRGSRRRQRRP